ncbi:MAG: M20 family peptidase [Actinomycetota bacterium]|nr:M20 family peptidase [Actinomycetota bacterium]
MVKLKSLSLIGGLAAAAGMARLARTRRLTQVQPSPIGPMGLGDEVVAEHLAELIRVETVSYDGRPPDATAFRHLHEWLEATYPKAHGTLEKEVVAEHSLLYTWRGGDGDGKPVLLMAHLDVVPVEPGTEDEWEHPPFGAQRGQGYLWGRGAMDDKAAVVGIFEAVERLVQEGFRPSRTVYLAFGHDEEVGGLQGARVIADLLRSRGVELEFVLDEGGFVMEGLIPGLRKPLALVGTCEKGFVSLELTAEGQGGHSSAPPPQTAVGIVAAAVARVEGNQMPSRVEALRGLFAHIAPAAPLRLRPLFGNFGLIGPFLERRLSANPTSAALIRTTTAATIIEGGVKQNVLPRRARAVINFRILPGDSIASVLEHVERVVDDRRVSIGLLADLPPVEPASQSSTQSDAFRVLTRAISRAFPDAVVAPWTLIGMTDSRHYQELAGDVYRFVPFRLVPEDRQRIHGTNERLRLDDCGNLVRFYHQLLADLQ